MHLYCPRHQVQALHWLVLILPLQHRIVHRNFHRRWSFHFHPCHHQAAFPLEDPFQSPVEGEDQSDLVPLVPLLLLHLQLRLLLLRRWILQLLLFRLLVHHWVSDLNLQRLHFRLLCLELHPSPSPFRPLCQDHPKVFHPQSMGRDHPHYLLLLPSPHPPHRQIVLLRCLYLGLLQYHPSCLPGLLDPYPQHLRGSPPPPRQRSHSVVEQILKDPHLQQRLC